MSSLTPAAPEGTGYIPPRFATLFPSIFREVVLRSLLFLVLFGGTVAWNLAILGETHSPGTGDHSITAWLLVASLAALVISYLGCSIIAGRFFSFGVELRNYSMFGTTTLWPLVLRMMVIPLVAAFVIAPLLAGYMAQAHWARLTHPWLFSLNIALLHAVFCMGAVFVGLTPAFNPVARYAILALFPFRFVSSGLAMASFWILFLLAQGIRAMLHYWEAVIVNLLHSISNSVDRLLLVPVVGPLVLFWLNPFYLLIKLHSADGMGLGPQLAFAMVCIVCTVAMFFRIRHWMTVDLDERSVEIYEQWLEMRQSIPLHEPAETPQHYRPAEPAPLLPAVPDIEDETPTDILDAGPPASRMNFDLPQDVSAEEYTASLQPKFSVYPNRFVSGFIALVALGAFYSVWMLPVATALWVIVTIQNLWSVPKASHILPLKVWPEIGRVIRIRLLPLLPIDAAIAITLTLVFKIELHNIIPLTLTLAGSRLVVLSLVISYVLQSAITVVFTLGCFLIYAYVSVMNLVMFNQPDERWVSWIILGVAWAAMAVSWLFTIIQLWRRSWLQHEARF